jgi:hypothetical protein
LERENSTSGFASVCKRYTEIYLTFLVMSIPVPLSPTKKLTLASVKQMKKLLAGQNSSIEGLTDGR